MRQNLLPIVGLPNVGKSTLLNMLFGQKVSIVTQKPQTTRNILPFSKMIGENEFILVDTPGLQNRKDRLNKIMHFGTQDYIDSLEEMILVLDATNPSIELFADYFKKSIVVLNKIDYLRKPKLLPIIQKLHELGASEIFPICAKTGDGVEKLSSYLKNRNLLPNENQESEVLNENIAFYACESVREKILLEFAQEVPYKVFIRPVSVVVPKESAWNMHLQIVVPKASYKLILLGQKGQIMKAIGMATRLEISMKLKQTGFLRLQVVVEPDLWKKRETYEYMGWI